MEKKIELRERSDSYVRDGERASDGYLWSPRGRRVVCTEKLWHYFRRPKSYKKLWLHISDDSDLILCNNVLPAYAQSHSTAFSFLKIFDDSFDVPYIGDSIRDEAVISELNQLVKKFPTFTTFFFWVEYE